MYSIERRYLPVYHSYLANAWVHRTHSIHASCKAIFAGIVFQHSNLCAAEWLALGRKVSMALNKLSPVEKTTRLQQHPDQRCRRGRVLDRHASRRVLRSQLGEATRNFEGGV
jgi:hypothetical protein